MKKITLIALLSLLSAPALAQQTAPPEQPTLEQLVTQKAKSTDGDKFITLSVENDMFGGGTDQNYTSGVRLSYYDMGMEMPKFAEWIDRAIPTFRLNDTSSIFYSVGHNLYTPKNIRTAVQNPNDRPWAAFLYASAGLNSITKNRVDNVEATVGVVGPAALGEQVQKFIHKHVSDSPTPRGWDNQLKNEPGLMLSWERSWPERYGFQTLGWTAAAVPYLGATIGNIYTYANTGISFRLTPYAGRFQDDPIRVRPAMPGTGAFLVPENTFNWYLFGGIEGRAVARNIFLDGNTFTDSHSVDKKNFVGDVNAGLALTYGKARISYSVVYRTSEFDESGSGDVFGTVSLGYRF